ncbi:Efc family protein [Penguinpox virus]|uniref:Efc family protein n=1 Tax=Penguinpox virus TaxID=648998 RepID=A0A068EFA2_9POXV|nr:Efc family protein [Penguinpox virus]AID46979.1 Efc family protein [Penguinpox virus]
MALDFKVRYIGQELMKSVLASVLDPLNSQNGYTGDGSFTVQIIKNTKFNSPRYLYAAEGDTVKIYFLEGKGGLIFSVKDMMSESSEEESGYIVEGDYVEFEAKFTCFITLACTDPKNTIIYWLE